MLTNHVGSFTPVISPEINQQDIARINKEYKDKFVENHLKQQDVFIKPSSNSYLQHYNYTGGKSPNNQNKELAINEEENNLPKKHIHNTVNNLITNKTLKNNHNTVNNNVVENANNYNKHNNYFTNAYHNNKEQSNTTTVHNHSSKSHKSHITNYNSLANINKSQVITKTNPANNSNHSTSNLTKPIYKAKQPNIDLPKFTQNSSNVNGEAVLQLKETILNLQEKLINKSNQIEQLVKSTSMELQNLNHNNYSNEPNTVYSLGKTEVFNNNHEL